MKTRARNGGLTVNPVGAVRLPGVSHDVCTDLRATSAAALHEQDMSLTEELGNAGERLADAIFPLVPGADAQTRRKLIKLRRAVYQGAGVDVDDSVRAYVAGQAPEVADLLDDYQRLCDRHRNTRSRLEEAFSTGVRDARDRLKKASREPAIAKALAVGSPELSRGVQRWRLSPTVAVRSKASRGIERSILKYLARASLKTSPFSSLTTVAPCLVRAEGPTTRALQGAGTGEAREVTHSQLNVVLLTRVLRAVVSGDALFELPLEVSDAVSRDSDLMRTVQRRVIDNDEVEAERDFDLVEDKLVWFYTSTILQSVLKALAPGTQLTGAELAETLRSEGLGDDDGCRRIVRQLVRLGVVECRLVRLSPYDDPLETLDNRLSPMNTPWAHAVREALLTLRGLRDRFSCADDAERLRILDEVRQTVRDMADGDIDLPKTLIYEDVVHPFSGGDAMVLSTRVRDDLASLRWLFHLLDPAEAHRHLLSAFFDARVPEGGTVEDVAGFLTEFDDDVYREFLAWGASTGTFSGLDYRPRANWLNDSVPPHCDAERLRLRDYIQERAGEEVIDLAGFAPEEHHRCSSFMHARSYTAFIQCPTGDSSEIILNKVHGGAGFSLSRFTGAFDAADPVHTAVAESMGSLNDAEVIWAEVPGSDATSNLNLHRSSFRYGLQLPGGPHLDTAVTPIRLDSLALRRAPTGRPMLWSKSLNRYVVPVYTGYLISRALPELTRLLLLLGDAVSPHLSLWDGVAVPADARGIVRRPAVRHGAVVLARESWSTPVGLWEAGMGREVDLETWARARKLARDLGLPPRAFYTVADGEVPSTRKPVFVDFDSPLSVDAMLNDRNVHQAATLTFHRVMPDPFGDQTEHDAAAVREFVIETHSAMTVSPPQKPADTAWTIRKEDARDTAH